jgi:4-amino-4-deoxy-L-arabinose transferase-like glycosyltransferase
MTAAGPTAPAGRARFWQIILVAAVFLSALGIRLYDLTDLPLDFHPTRQLFSALKARGIYYQSAPGVPDWQRQMAIDQWQQQATIEPPVLEFLVAKTYQLAGGADLWIARIYSIIFWMLGGAAVYLLAKELTSWTGGLVAASFFLFLPYGIIASRSFQPDPLMVALTAGFLWALIRWQSARTWRWAVTAGLFGGLAIFIKTTAVFFVAGGMAGVLLGMTGLRLALRNRQAWLLGGLIILPTAAYYIYGVAVAGTLGQQFGGRFVPSLLVSPAFYLGWISNINTVVGYLPFALALFGTLLFANKPARSLAFGLWGGYLAYGILFNYHNATHDYYQLPLILITALCLAPLAETLTVRLGAVWQTRFPVRAAAVLLLAFSLVMTSWDVRRELRNTDYRPQAEFWADMGKLLGHDRSIVGLTQDYGYRAEYWGWMHITNWPSLGDLQYQTLAFGAESNFEDTFATLTDGREFFLVTDFEEFDRQTQLQELLYARYPVFARSDDFILFDLLHPITTP